MGLLISGVSGSEEPTSNHNGTTGTTDGQRSSYVVLVVPSWRISPAFLSVLAVPLRALR
jgi:hypothetical protein